jgi:PHD/YefM family antitoxin component YafN of YafNO toxin-antitoxin module
MNALILTRKFSRRVIRLFNSLILYSKDELGSEVTLMSKNEKPVWITRDGVDVAVVISPEMFNELVEAQEELEDIAAVDAAQRDKSPGIPWERVIEAQEKVEYVVGPDIDLDVEVVLDKQGNRITEARAQEMAREILREVRADRAAEIEKREALKVIAGIYELLAILEIETLEKYFGVSESKIDEWLEGESQLSDDQAKLMLDLKYITEVLEFHIHPDQISQWLVGNNPQLNFAAPIDVLTLKGMLAVLPAVAALSELYFEKQATPLIKKRLNRMGEAVSVDIDDLEKN